MVSTRALGARKGAKRPNIIFILADDMGWGDIGAYNPDSAVPTPNLDRLAQGGMRFTDMHSSSAVCTPSRYSILTGRYAWRSRLKHGVLNGYDPSLIEDRRLTVAGMLRKAGYYTAGVGKWHLGLGHSEKTDYSKPLNPAPTDHGFDYYFGIPASLDMPPYLYFENDRAVAQPTDETPGAKQKERGVFWRAGPMMPGFDFAQVVPTLTRKATDIIAARARKPDQPFFLYFPLPSPHTPWVPTEAYKGKSRAGTYGDYAYETDAMVGQVITALEDHGLADDTIVVFTSDNGADWNEEDIARYPHRANARWRGRKADVWEAGHRIPFLVKWPGHIQPGSTSAEIASLTDFMATVASILDLPLPDDAAEDSFDLSGVMAGTNTKPVRTTIVEHSLDGTFVIREGNWKLEMALGSGGFTLPRKLEPTPDGPKGQLYDLGSDPGETNNLWDRKPEIVERLSALLRQYQESGRTRPAAG
ncbi:MAG: hypothetical protein DI605_13540 [Sphingomonas sp.]|nr:MAG: hypothetical protein DI605_13540 [Sphingomonas sp.]